jgi:hypothetical protein
VSKRTERRRLVRQELEGIELGDERRAKRAKYIVERLADSPEASLPIAMGDSAAVEALYRHLGSADVSLQAILQPHVEKTVGRVRHFDTVYAVADTTEFLFSGRAEREGLGTVHGEDQGFLAHVTLAVAPDRTPVGLLGIETWNRPELKGDRDLWSRRNDSGRESKRWARGMRTARERLGESAGKIVHVADREGDIYELIAELAHEKQRFIIRAAQDRVVEPMSGEDERRLFDAAQSTPTAFVLDVPLSGRGRARLLSQRRRHPARRERTAHLSFAARSVTLKRPGQRSARLPASVVVNVVHVFELGAPPGEPRVEWVLLTSEPIETNQDVENVVRGYRARWVVEEYFKAVKTGCAFESRQLESAQTLEALLGYTLLVAYALLLMRSLSRQERDEPASVLLSPTQLKILQLKARKLPLEPTVRQALFAVAAMGGHLKNNGDPGWRTLSKGWSRLLALEEGYELARALTEK